MPRGTWNQEWLNQNSQRAYPLTEFATKKDRSGTLALPDDFILAITFPVHAGNDVQPSKFYLKEIGVFSAGFSISIGYNSSAEDADVEDDINRPTVATTLFSRNSHAEYASYALAGTGDFADAVGQINIGKISTLSAAASGTYLFNPDDGYLEVETIDPMIRQVQGLVVINNGERSATLYGDIELFAGTNMRLDVTQGTSDTDAKITFNAIDGAGLSDDCVCEDDSAGPCIRTINGIPPTTAGNFQIVGDTCLEVQTITNGIKLVDKCSEPCCDCAELEALTLEVNTLHNASNNVQGFVNRLQAEISNMDATIIGSILSDDKCVSCE